MADRSITLHSSWKGLILSLSGAAMVFGIGLWATIASGGATVSIVLLVLGSILLVAVLFDYPVASTFTEDAVERRALLRHHRIEWGRVDQLTRSRPAMGGLRDLTPGPIAAKIKRRRYLLVDQCEAMSEFTALGDVLKHRYVDLALDEMLTPPTDNDPTWTYRRKRWVPDS